MARIWPSGKTLQVSLSARERYLLQRPNLALELARITGLETLESIGKVQLGIRITKRPIFGGLVGEYRYGTRRILVLGKSRGGGVF